METEFEALTKAIWALKPKDKYYAWVVVRLTANSPVSMDNILKKEKEGWVFVPANRYWDTFLSDISLKFETTLLTQTTIIFNLISSNDFVLMECPIELHEQYIKAEEEKAAAQLAIAMQAIKEEGNEGGYEIPQEKYVGINIDESNNEEAKRIKALIEKPLEKANYSDTNVSRFFFEVDYVTEYLTLSAQKDLKSLEVIGECIYFTTNIECRIAFTKVNQSVIEKLVLEIYPSLISTRYINKFTEKVEYNVADRIMDILKDLKVIK